MAKEAMQSVVEGVGASSAAAAADVAVIVSACLFKREQCRWPGEGERRTREGNMPLVRDRTTPQGHNRLRKLT